MSAERLKRRILVVDDDPSLLDLASMILSDEGGHQVIVCQRPTEVEGIIRGASKPSDMLIVDLNMPGLNGEKIVKNASQECPDLVTILWTAESHVGERLLRSVDGVFKKPFDIDELLKLAGSSREYIRENYRGLPSIVG